MLCHDNNFGIIGPSPNIIKINHGKYNFEVKFNHKKHAKIGIEMCKKCHPFEMAKRKIDDDLCSLCHYNDSYGVHCSSSVCHSNW